MRSKESTMAHWETFWKNKKQIEEVYSNEDRIYLNLRQVTEIPGKKILEVGAGSGRDSFKLADEQGTVFVLDYSPQALKIIQELNKNSEDQVYLILGDAIQIPIRDESMDVVFHQGLMEHFKEPLSLLQQQFRILKRGGFLLVDVPQKYHIYSLIKHILIFFNQWFAGWETEFSIRQLKKLLERSGFSIRHQYGRWMRPSLCYRVAREVLKKINIRLPLYPAGFKVMDKIRAGLRDRLNSKLWAFYTFVDIGVIGQKRFNPRRDSGNSS